MSVLLVEWCPPSLFSVSLKVSHTVYVDVHGSARHVPRWAVGEGLRIPLCVQHLCTRVARGGMEDTYHDQRQGEDDYLQDRRFPHTHTKPSPWPWRPYKAIARCERLWPL